MAKSNTVATISKLAKKIRRKGEGWTDAIKRASKQLNGAKKKAPAKKRRKVGKVARKKKATSFRQTGTSIKKFDKLVRAKAPGKRKSATGRKYYERRKNRSDVPGTLTGVGVGAIRSELKRRAEEGLAAGFLAREKATTLKQHKAAMSKINKFRKELRGIK